MARTLFDCAEICSDFPDSEKEKENVAKALQSNGYPRRLVAKKWRPPPRSQCPKQDPPTATVTLLYVRHLSETIRRILAPLGDLHILLAPLHTSTDIGEAEGPHLHSKELVWFSNYGGHQLHLSICSDSRVGLAYLLLHHIVQPYLLLVQPSRSGSQVLATSQPYCNQCISRWEVKNQG